jgi:hypothetical protein
MDAVLFTLKLAGLAIASCLGVFGTIHDYRDKSSGRLTRWGRFAIVALIVSALVAISAQVVEEYLKDKSTKEAAVQAATSAARSEQVVLELARVLQPLDFKSLHISELGVPLDDARFKSLRAHIDSIAAKYQVLYEQSRIPLRSEGVSVPSADCTRRVDRCSPLEIQIDSTNPHFPKRGIGAAVFRINSVLIAIYRKPIDPRRFERLIVDGENDADLSLNFGDLAGRTPLSLSKRLDSQSYKLTGSYFSSYIRRDTSGRVASIPDLEGSQIFLRLPANSLPDSMVSMNLGVALPQSARVKQSDVIAYQRRFELGAVAISIGARTMWVPKTGWRKHVTDNAVYWEYVIPKEPFKFGPDGPR